MRRDILIYENEYHTWLKGKYIGILTWSNDTNVGEIFTRMSINDTGELVNEVHRPDEWEFVI